MLPRRSMIAFTLPCANRFKRFVGELTATFAGIHTAVVSTAGELDLISCTDPWAALADKHGIRVSGLASEQLLISSSRLGLVSLYSGFDFFMQGLRSDWQHLTKQTWQRRQEDTPFDEIFRHCSPDAKGALKARMGPDREVGLEYYRKARHAIVHPGKRASRSVAECFLDHKEQLATLRSRYGMRTAPNDMSSISFHDVKLLARVSLDIVPAITEYFDPGDQALLSVAPVERWKHLKRDRFERRIAGWLRTEYGLDPERATLISQSAH